MHVAVVAKFRADPTTLVVQAAPKGFARRRGTGDVIADWRVVANPAGCAEVRELGRLGRDEVLPEGTRRQRARHRSRALGDVAERFERPRGGEPGFDLGDVRGGRRFVVVAVARGGGAVLRDDGQAVAHERHDVGLVRRAKDLKQDPSLRRVRAGAAVASVRAEHLGELTKRERATRRDFLLPLSRVHPSGIRTRAPRRG